MKNKGLIPNQGKEIEKNSKVEQATQQQSVEALLLQFNDHVRNINKSLVAMGDITTILYNEVVARDQQLKAISEKSGS